MYRRLIAFVAAAGVSLIAASSALAAGAPVVGTGSAKAITSSGAVLTAALNPRGVTTIYYFQYGQTTAYGGTTAQHSAGHGTDAVTAKAGVTGLLPDTVYHFRVVAQSSGGQTIGADHTFRTTGHPLAAVETGGAASITQSSAFLTGVINPNDQATSYAFQLGTTPNYGLTVNGPNTLAAGTAPVPIGVTAPGLASGTVYHYRLVAFHGGVPSVGGDGTFVTLPSSKYATTISAKTTPSTDAKVPYVLTTSGKIGGYPSTWPAGTACTGQVKVQLYNGSRHVSTQYAALGSNCVYSATATLNKLPKHPKGTKSVKLTVRVYFEGNGYLKTKIGDHHTVTIG